MEKRALAWLMKKNRSVTGKWIADRIQMGHALTASPAINRFAEDPSRNAVRIRKELQKKLLKE
jgi:hypothetical protein